MENVMLVLHKVVFIDFIASQSIKFYIGSIFPSCVHIKQSSFYIPKAMCVNFNLSTDLLARFLIFWPLSVQFLILINSSNFHNVESKVKQN